MAEWAAIEKEHGKFWTKRLGCGGTYNCAGHALGARRTAIYGTDDEPLEVLVLRVLQEDGWTHRADPPLPGDLALYWDRREKGCGLIHMGVVVRVDNHKLGQIWVNSKWSDSSGEFIHGVNDVDHIRKAVPDKLETEYWRNVFLT